MGGNFGPIRGPFGSEWLLVMTKRNLLATLRRPSRAVDRVRAETSATQRDQKFAPDPVTGPDDVAEAVEASLDSQRVRRCLGGLTEIQREAVQLAYYGGYTYPQVAKLLGVALGTVKTRIRDGLIRMRDCMEVGL